MSGLIDFVQEKWYVLFLASGLYSIWSKEGGKGRKFQQVVALVALVLVSVRLERVVSQNILGPLLKKFLGDNDELRRRIEREEAEMLSKLRRMQEDKEDKEEKEE